MTYDEIAILLFQVRNSYARLHSWPPELFLLSDNHSLLYFFGEQPEGFTHLSEEDHASEDWEIHQMAQG